MVQGRLLDVRMGPLVVALALLATLGVVMPTGARADVWWSVSLTAEVIDGQGAPAQGVPVAYWFSDWMNPDEGVMVTGADGTAHRHHAGFEGDGYGFDGGFSLQLDDPHGVYSVARTESDGFFGDEDNVWLHKTYCLADAGAIAGVVRDASGLPMQGVGVELYVSTPDSSLQRVVDVVSDPVGRYRFAGLSSRSYAVRFSYGSPYGPRFWGGGVDPASAGLIALGQDEARLDVDGEPFERQPGSLGGWVATKSSMMGVDVPVHAWRIAEDGQLLEAGATTTDESGYYVIGGLEPGSYTLSIDLGRQARPLWLGNAHKADDAEMVTVDWDEHVVGLAFEVPRGKLSSPATRRR